MSANKKSNPFLKKSTGSKPPTRNAIKAQQRKGGLGRVGHGLNSLIPPAEKEEVPSVAPAAAPVAAVAPAAAVATEPAAGNIIELPPLDILRCPWQPRSEFNEELLRELADSIKANGIIQPPVCRRLPNGKYELIVGERRLRASVMAGLTKIKVVLVDASDQKVAEMAVTENIQRRDLNVIEEAEGYRLLQDKFGLTQEAVSERVGKSRPAIANALRLLDLPDEVKQLIAQNLISTGHAKVLLSEEDEKERILLARSVVNDGLTVRALENRISRRKNPPAPSRVTPDLTDAYVRSLTDAIRRQVGCAVRLSPAATCANGKRLKGVLQFDFTNNDDLDRIVAILGVKLD
jgi:ParB family chromosome partitioning protein